MSFFGKPTATNSATKTPDPKAKLKAKTDSASKPSTTGVTSPKARRRSDAAHSSDPAVEGPSGPASGTRVVPRTPSVKRGPSQSQSSGLGVSSAKYSRSSAGGASLRDTPPTSDPVSIDVDMFSEGEETNNRVAEEKASSSSARVSHCLGDHSSLTC